MRNNLAALLIAVNLLTTTTTVKAETITNHDRVKIRAVEHTDLDLATSDGRTKLNRRIAVALESVCGSYAGRTAEEEKDVTRCRRAAITLIEPQVARLLITRVLVQSAMANR